MKYLSSSLHRESCAQLHATRRRRRRRRIGRGHGDDSITIFIAVPEVIIANGFFRF